MKRKFSCNRWNGFSIRNHYFTPNASGHGCWFETEDPDVIALIESCGDYGVNIHPVETPEEIAAAKVAEQRAKTKPKAEEKPEPEPKPPEPEAPEPEQPIAVQGARGTGRSSSEQRRGHIISGGKP